MSAEKYILDGKVAVLHGLKPGSGWSTWNPEIAHDLIFDRDIVQAVLDGDQDRAREIAWDKYREPTKAFLCTNPLGVFWVPVGTKFMIEEHAGMETVILYDDLPIFTA